MSELLFTCFTSKWQTELDQNESHLGAGFCPSFRRIQCKPVENPTVGFIKTHVDREFQNHQTNVKASYLLICILNSGLPASEANHEAPRPEIHRHSAAEAPGHPCLAPPATPPPPGASPPPRGLRQRPSATGSGLRQPMLQRRVQCLKDKRFAVGLSWIGQNHPKSSSPRFPTLF